jgi:hypothetical protein
MPYQINRAALDDFLARQVDIVERTPIPDEVAQLVAAEDETLSADELRAVWLGAGLATHVGLALVEQPERFIRATAPTA